MSLLPHDTFVNANRQLFADLGSGGGGGGGSTLQSPASITAAPAGTCSLLIQSIDSTPATLTVTTGGGGADTGAATLTVTGGASTNLNVTTDGAGPAAVNVLGGTAGNAIVDLVADAGQSSIISLQSGIVANTTTIEQLGNVLTVSTPTVQNAISVSSGSNKVTVVGLTVADDTIAGVQGAITGQNVLGPSATPLASGVPTTQTVYPLPAPAAGANNVGWWCYAVGTGETGAPSLNSIQSSISVLAYWNGTTWSKGGNMCQVLGGIGGWTAAYFAQFFLSLDRTTINFYFNIGVAGTLTDMTWVATQMTGAQAGF